MVWLWLLGFLWLFSFVLGATRTQMQKCNKRCPLWECEFEGMHERSNDYLFARKDCLVGQNDSFVLKEQNRNKASSYDWRMIGRFI